MKLPFLKNPIIRFLVLFIVLLLLLDNCATAYIGITSPGNTYYSFLDHYLNVFDWYRTYLLNGAHYLTDVVGCPSFISDKFHLRLVGGRSIQIVYSCLGVGLLSLWTAYIIAYPAKIKKKFAWLFLGLFLISFLNMVRLAALVIIVTKTKWNFENHHTYFNVAVYICITIMIYFYTKEPKEDSLSKK